jgi:hypothetical protein
MPEYNQLAMDANKAIKQQARASNGVSDDDYEDEFNEEEQTPDKQGNKEAEPEK